MAQKFAMEVASVIPNYDSWLDEQEEEFESLEDDEPTRDELIEAGVLADEEDEDD